jgi:hypothetical protein
MGKTAQDLLDAGSHEVVVLHDAVLVRDPDDVTTDPREYSYGPVSRGATVTLDEAAYKRLSALGAVADTDSAEARYALAGIRPGDTQIPPSALPMQGPTAERVRATQTAAGYPGGPNPSVRSGAELMRLSVDDLRIVAVAFGVHVEDDDTKESLVEKLKTGGVEQSTVDAQRGARDERQLDARELAGAARAVPTLSDDDAGRNSGGETDVGHGLDEQSDQVSESGTTAEDVQEATTRTPSGPSPRAGTSRSSGRSRSS